MTNLIPTANQILSLLTIIGQVISILILVYFLIYKKQAATKPLLNNISQNSIALAFVVALIATLGSLFYSEIVGLVPCKLCWFQRILMYPQVILLGLALWKKDKNIVDYSLVLSLIGAVIAGYHYFLQMTAIPSPFCRTAGLESCSNFGIINYGYITIPMMALTAFLMITIFSLIKKSNKI